MLASEFVPKLSIVTATPEVAGGHIAVLGERYVACQNWASVASKVSADVTCGCVHPPSAGSHVDWAIYLAEYSHVAPPMRGHAMTEKELQAIPDGNVVYVRDVAEFASQPELRPGLFRAGRTFYFEPDLAVRYERIPYLKDYLYQRYRDSREWAVRASGKQTVAYRYRSAASRLALPLLLLWRRGRNVANRKRYAGKFLTSLPLLVLFGVVEAAGEIAGFLGGARE